MATPRYLFRAFSPDSDGINCRAGFRSQAGTNNNDSAKSLSEVDPEEARQMLKDHVLWETFMNRDNDLLISFTSSLLLALHHCVCKIFRQRNTDEGNCYITVIDTSHYPSGTFKWTVDLLKHYRLDERNNRILRHEHHESEYLVENELPLDESSGASLTVPLTDLIERGSLFELMSELNWTSFRTQLWKRLKQVRVVWYLVPEEIEPVDVAQARRLATCFGGKWMLPIMAWGLAVRNREGQEEILREIFAHMNLEDSSKSSIYSHPVSDLGSPIPDSLREVQEWCQIMNIALDVQRQKARQTPSSFNSEHQTSAHLSEGIENLTILNDHKPTNSGTTTLT